MLPEFARTGAFPAAAGFGPGLGLADEVGKMRLDKSGDRLAMTLEVKAEGQFIGGQLKVGRLLQRNKILQKLAGLRWPVWPMVSAGEFGAESGALFQPTSAQAVKVRLTDLEVLGGFLAVDLPAIKQLQDMLKKGRVRRWANCFFQVQHEPQSSLGRGSSSASATLRPPQTLDQGTVPTVNTFLLLNSRHSPFVPAPTVNFFDGRRRRASHFFPSALSGRILTLPPIM